MENAATEKSKRVLEPETFNFCVGRPWPKNPKNPSDTALNIYAYGSQIHHGTMANAEKFRDYVNAQTGEENFIYKLVCV